MKLKAQIQAEIKYAINNRKNNSNPAEQFYYIGIRDALEWVQQSKGIATHIDNTPAPLDEGINFEDN